jgi:hypothetical protein
MKTSWWIANAIVLAAWVSISIYLSHRKAITAAQAVAIVFLGYVLVFIALWGMASSFIRQPEVEVLRPAKRILLAMTGGLLAQLLIILDQCLKGTLPKKRVAPIYVRGVTGALAGPVGLLIVSALSSSVAQVDDPLAVLCGVAGGGLGASVLALAKDKVFGSHKK